MQVHAPFGPRKRQGGMALMGFVLAVSVLAFSLVIGYSAVLTRTHANSVLEKQRAYVAQAAEGLRSFYRLRATDLSASLDGNLTWSSFTDEAQVLAATGIAQRWGVRGAISQRLAGPGGLMYRRMVVWLPTNTDATNPPDVEGFELTGAWQPCANMAEPCDERVFAIVDGLPIQRELHIAAQERLRRIAYKLQAYFKARMFLDPERNVSVNYFKDPLGGCAALEQDIGCLPEYVSLAETTIPMVANLSPDELVNPWGAPIEVSNVVDSETSRAPFSMSLRTQAPFGPTAPQYRILALQQL